MLFPDNRSLAAARPQELAESPQCRSSVSRDWPSEQGVVETLEGRVFLSASVTTYHNGNLRLGQNTQETQLTVSDVKKGSFGLQQTVNVDGSVYAQPLYLPHVSVPGQGVHDVVYVATEHDSLYAIDSDTGSVLWRRNYLRPGEQTVKSADVQTEDISPEIGITGTPVIDSGSHTIYFVTKAKKTVNGSTSYVQRLQAVDTRSGISKGSTVIKATVTGAGAGRVGNEDPKLSFDPLRQSNRPGLLLLNGVVYVGFGSHGDNDPYHGWLLGYNAKTLSQVSVLNTTPDGLRGPIWQGGGAPAALGDSIFVGTGNGTFDATSGGRDYGDSLLRISTANGGLKIADSFTPYDQATKGLLLDKDFGSGGVMLLPDQHLAIVGDKQGKLYVADTRNLGGFHTDGNHITQTLQATPDIVYSTPAYLNGSIYLAGLNDSLKQFKIVNGKLVLASQSKTKFGYPGATSSVSSNGTSNGIVWAIERGPAPAGGADAGEQAVAGPMILHAYDANDLSHELWASNNDGRDDGPYNTAVKFSVPTIADGHVFVGTNGALKIFGLT